MRCLWACMYVYMCDVCPRQEEEAGRSLQLEERLRSHYSVVLEHMEAQLKMVGGYYKQHDILANSSLHYLLQALRLQDDADKLWLEVGVASVRPSASDPDCVRASVCVCPTGCGAAEPAAGGGAAGLRGEVSAPVRHQAARVRGEDGAAAGQVRAGAAAGAVPDETHAPLSLHLHLCLYLSVCVVGGQCGRGGPAAVRESHAAAEAVLLALEDGLPAGDARQVPGPVLRHGGALHEVPSLPAQTWLSLLTVTVAPLNRISEVSALLQEVNDCKAALAEANRAVDAREKEMAKMQTMVIRIPSCRPWMTRLDLTRPALPCRPPLSR